VELMPAAKKPVFYTGGGVINSGPEASSCCASWCALTGFPITSTLMGLGAYPASDKNWLGMLGMHGTYEANMAMHDCDVMINIGARFDDRITGRSMRSRRAPRRSTSISIPSSINKVIKVDIRSSAMSAMSEEMVRSGRRARHKPDKAALKSGGADRQVARRNSLA
jgi:acetolactate synthase-1/2/3 large subunit